LTFKVYRERKNENSIAVPSNVTSWLLCLSVTWSHQGGHRVGGGCNKWS